METDKYKIGFIVSGKKQIQNALATIQDESVEFRVVRAGLDEAIPIGKNMEEERFEAILAYRGTAAMLRENQTVPVITMLIGDVVSAIASAPDSIFDFCLCSIVKTFVSPVMV